MTYASGGLIQALDANTLIGGNALTSGGGVQLNPVWSVGLGNYGYGQTLISNVAVGNGVQAAKWAEIVNKLNSARIHQSGSGSGITAPTAGTTITYLSTLSSAITTAATNRLSAATLGTTTSLTKSATLSAASGVTATQTLTWTATFSSADAARYFFNCGGYFTVSYSSATNNNGTARGTSQQTLAQTNFSSKRMYASSFGARTGTGGTLNTDTTTGGFYAGTTSAVVNFKVTSNGYYSSDYHQLAYYHNGIVGNHGGAGSVLTFQYTMYSGITGATGAQDAINELIVMNLTAQYPESTNITNTWGTVTLA